MTIFTYSQARQNFASVLDLAKTEGKVLIRRKDGSLFALCPETPNDSPLDVAGIKTRATTQDIVKAVRESRQR
jgi:hypothetical protein